LNLLLLMAVAFLPFPSRLMAEAIRDSAPSARPSSSTAARCSSSRSCSAPSGASSRAAANCSGRT
jgi:hypothetical protein